MPTDNIIKNAVNDIENLLYAYRDSKSTKDNKKAELLSYWLSDYCKMLKKEATFNPTKLKRYKRGEIVKVHLGYNIGSEEGGLHYAVILDKNNSPSNPTVTIIPLTSVKPHTDLEHLHPSKIFLGDYIFCSLNKKLATQEHDLQTALNEINGKIATLKNAVTAATDDELLNLKGIHAQKVQELHEDAEKISAQREQNIKLQREIAKMKAGSIALISQITTVSKIRIYDPLYSSSTLSNIRLTPQLLNLVDQKICELFVKTE